MATASFRYMDSGACSSDVWGLWCAGYSGAASVTTYNYTASSDVIWVNWNANQTGSSANLIWGSWNANQNHIIHVDRVHSERDENRKKQEKAAVIAKDLLLKHLSPQQRDQFEKDRMFEVLGKTQKNRYLIGADGSVKRVDEKGLVESYCIHPDYSRDPDFKIPASDLALAKKLMLEHDEETFLKTANATRLRAA